MDEETEREIVIDALQDVLIDVNEYAKGHYGQDPLRPETVQKVRAALRLIGKDETA